MKTPGGVDRGQRPSRCHREPPTSSEGGVAGGSRPPLRGGAEDPTVSEANEEAEARGEASPPKAPSETCYKTLYRVKDGEGLLSPSLCEQQALQTFVRAGRVSGAFTDWQVAEVGTVTEGEHRGGRNGGNAGSAPRSSTGARQALPGWGG